MSRLPDPLLWKERRVLVTGHTGFKGAWLAGWLVQMGAQVCGLALEPEESPNLFDGCRLSERFESHFGDIRHPEVVSRVCTEFQPEFIFHLAAQSLVRASYEKPLETYATNVMGTAHVLEAARQLECLRAVVVVTTDKCYENKEWLWGYRENDRLGGHDPYSNSKACAELVTDAYRRSFLAEQGKLIASARAGNVIGGGDYAKDRLVPDAIRAFRQGRPLEIRSPGATRPWQHVLDPLCGYLLLGEQLLKGDRSFAEAFNFGPAGEHTVGQVAQELVRGWGAGASFEAPPGEHPHEASRLHLDSSKARHHLQWSPRFDFHQSLEATISFYRHWTEGADPWQLMMADISRYTEKAVAPL